MALTSHRVTRYAAPLREGGSLPGLVETENGETVVAKWRGAGQGAAALVAEVIVGEMARAIGLPMPTLCTLTLDDTIGRNERDPEIRDLLVASEGLNLGMQFLRGGFNFDPAAHVDVAGELATRIVVFDAFVSNVDRTPRNPNLMWWEDALWLIDHGASLYWHHGWDGEVSRPERPFPMIRDHVLLPRVDEVQGHGEALLGRLSNEVIAAAVEQVPDEWLPEPASDRRQAYLEFLQRRRDAGEQILQEVVDARAAL